MITTSLVTEDDCRHDADQVDPTAPGYGAHLPFHSILQRCGLAWRHFLESMPLEAGVIVPNVNADFLAEVTVGTLDIEVTLVGVGGSSFTLRCEVAQDGVVAARVAVVLVSFDYERKSSLPLGDAQREWLAQVPQNVR